MSINQSFAHQKGQFSLRSIDFSINESYQQSDLKGQTNNHCGELKIQGQSFKLKYHELERVIDTLTNAKETIYKMHKMGLMIK